MSFDFGSLNNNKKKTSTSKRTSKTPAKSSSKSSSSRTSSSKSSSSRSTSRSRSRSRSRNPLEALFKGKNKNLYTYGGLVGGILILLIIVVFCFSGGSSSTSSNSPKKDISFYHNQAYDYTNKGEFEKAIEAYKKAYELDPTDSYATDQISILYRTEFHDIAQAEYWKSKSDQVTANKVDSNRGASAKAYEEKAARKAQRRNGGRR